MPKKKALVKKLPFVPSSVLAKNCPSRTLLQHVTSRWGLLCLAVLQGGTLRFGEIRNLIGGVSERMLSMSLKQLVNDGFVKRVAHTVVPPHVEYSLSERGQVIAEKLDDLITLIEQYYDEQRNGR